MSLLLFEDDQAARLAPATLLRPAFVVACGGSRLIDRLAELDLPVRSFTRPHLEASVAVDFPANHSADAADPWSVFVNARLVPSAAVLAELRRLVAEGRAGIVSDGDAVAAAVVAVDTFPAGVPKPHDKIAGALHALKLPRLDADLPLLEYPHDIIRYHLETLDDNLQQFVNAGDYRQTEDGVFLARDVDIGSHVVFDTDRGPVVVERGTSIGPHSFLSGPVRLGPHATVVDHARIRGHVAAGHATKLGGEISCSVIEPYTNKSHHGFLGHSYLGSWVNLGAGTTNSNLKNTYGMVRMTYGGQKIDTGMQFMGCVVGDYCKTAINSSIFTGKTIGAWSTLYGFVTENIPSLVNYARQFGEVKEVSVEVARQMQARAFDRRGLTPRPCDVVLIESLAELTRDERRQFDPDMRCGPLKF